MIFKKLKEFFLSLEVSLSRQMCFTTSLLQLFQMCTWHIPMYIRVICATPSLRVSEEKNNKIVLKIIK